MKRARRDRRLWFRVSDMEKRQLDRAARMRGTTASHLVRDVIRQIVNGDPRR